MKIAGMFKSSKNGKIKAFFNIETDKIELKGFKLIENDKGELWAAPPSKEYLDKDGNKKYETIIRIKDKVLFDKISDLARQEYNKENEPVTDDIPF
jgi:DNA-binding cell septation regulator SpoVG